MGDLDFSHEKWGVGKIGSFLKREVSLIFTLTNPFYYHLSLCVLHVCLFCLDLAFLNLLELSLLESFEFRSYSLKIFVIIQMNFSHMAYHFI